MAQLKWGYVITQHQQHGERGFCAFDKCETEPCPTFRKIMPHHHWHGPDIGPGKICCGCGADPIEVKRFGNENCCPDDRSVPIK